jgi:hypothetical protein
MDTYSVELAGPTTPADVEGVETNEPDPVPAAADLRAAPGADFSQAGQMPALQPQQVPVHPTAIPTQHSTAAQIQATVTYDGTKEEEAAVEAEKAEQEEAEIDARAEEARQEEETEAREKAEEERLREKEEAEEAEQAQATVSAEEELDDGGA